MSSPSDALGVSGGGVRGDEENATLVIGGVLSNRGEGMSELGMNHFQEPTY
jgi:hypothetical protein